MLRLPSGLGVHAEAKVSLSLDPGQAPTPPRWLASKTTRGDTVELEIPEMLAAVLQGQVGAQSPLGLQLSGYGAGSGVRIVSSQHFDGHSLNLLFQLGMAAGARDLVFQLLALDNLNGEPLARPI